MFQLIRGLIGREKADKEATGPFNISRKSEVLGTEYERSEIEINIVNRREHLETIRSRIRERWGDYQFFLEQASESSGIDELEAKTKAKEKKKAAKDYEKLYKLLWKEMAALKNAMRKDEQVKIISGDTYSVSLSDVDSSAVERMAEEHRSVLRNRDRKVEEFWKGVDKTEQEDIEIDFSDLDKDIEELEMDAAEIQEDLQIVVEDPDEPLVESEEWS